MTQEKYRPTTVLGEYIDDRIQPLANETLRQAHEIARQANEIARLTKENAEFRRRLLALEAQ
jgi:uncharacterized NAD(P)/FAD-binding protein YdhS